MVLRRPTSSSIRHRTRRASWVRPSCLPLSCISARANSSSVEYVGNLILLANREAMPGLVARNASVCFSYPARMMIRFSRSSSARLSSVCTASAPNRSLCPSPSLTRL